MTPPTPDQAIKEYPVELREWIARIIDPEAFNLPRINLYRAQIEGALAKADEILSLLPHPPGSGGHAELAERFQRVAEAFSDPSWSDDAAVFLSCEDWTVDDTLTVKDLHQAAQALRSIPNPEPDKALVEALKPFANLVAEEDGDQTKVWPGDPDHWTAFDHAWGRRLNVGMMRALKATLHRLQPQQGGDAPQAEGGGNG